MSYLRSRSPWPVSSCIAAAAAAAALTLGAATASSPPPQPNVVLIVADDLGYNEIGYTGDNPFVTPNIDALAEIGIRFTNGYVSCPVCGPSRAGLVLGLKSWPRIPDFEVFCPLRL